MDVWKREHGTAEERMIIGGDGIVITLALTNHDILPTESGQKASLVVMIPFGDEYAEASDALQSGTLFALRSARTDAAVCEVNVRRVAMQ